ncbi:MAG: inositol monophosphatase family protein [Flavobacteriaceae bacterium]|nr:inositol monophosphatase family protein [Flavobacteriaceae bacterium]
MNYKKLLEAATHAAVLAGKEIMSQYHNGFDVITKPDNSPVTTADLAAHDIILKELESTQIAVLSEEGEKFSHEFRQNTPYWCVDPIDGTRDFVNKTDEFCISIGLVVDNTSKVGVLYAPAMDLYYFAAEGMGSFKYEKDRISLEKLIDSDDFFQLLQENSQKLPQHPLPEFPTALNSRFHRDEKTEDYLNQLKTQNPNWQFIVMGSAIKLGIIAEGKATEYTRFMGVNFWDIAGGHAIAKYAGLAVMQIDKEKEINYSDQNMRVAGYCLQW